MSEWFKELVLKFVLVIGRLIPENPWFIRDFWTFTTEYFCLFSPVVLSFFQGLIFEQRIEIDVEGYRSGHNEVVLKTICPSGTWVRISHPPPLSLQIFGFAGSFFTLKLRHASERTTHSREHRISGVELGIVVQMSINISRSAEIGVTEPFLNLLHRYTVL